VGLDPSLYTNDALPTTADVKALVNVSSGASTPFAILELLDFANNPLNILPDGTNDLTANGFVISVGWTKNTGDDVEGSASLVLARGVDAYIDARSDRIRISHAYIDPLTGTEIQRFPVGTYLIPLGDRDIFDGDREYTFKVYDESWKLGELKAITPYAGPRGAKYTTLLKTLLKMDYLTPGDGGRAPSGVAGPGGPLDNLPTPGSYAGIGVAASSIATINPTTGYLDSPAGPLGVISYNPYDAARVDPDTYAPISPFDGSTMGQIPWSDNAYWSDAGLGFYFKPATGEWFVPFTQTSGPGPVYDIFTKAPALVTYLQVDPADPPSGTIGSALPALATWPADYNGTGPFYQNTTRATITVPSGGVTGPLLINAPAQGTWGQRYGDGRTLVVPNGDYASEPGAGITDPAHPAHNWIQAPGVGSVGPQALIPGLWSFAATHWTISLELIGAPFPQGSVAMSVDLYESELGLLASFPMCDPVSFRGIADIEPIRLTCAGDVGDFSANYPEFLWAKITLHVTEPLTVDLDASGLASGAFTLGTCTFAWTTPPFITTGTYDNGILTPALEIPGIPEWSGTTVPWPDTNNPAIGPSGCGQEGPNIPASRIDIPDLPDALPTTLTWNVGETLASYVQQILDALNAEKIRVSETMIWTTVRQPYYGTDAIPAAVWRFSNESPAPDGKILPPVTERVADDIDGANVILVIGASNTQTAVVSSKRVNDDPDSGISRTNVHRTIHKIIQDSTILTQEDADTRADLERQTAGEGTDSVVFKTYINPLLSVEDPIDLYVIDFETSEIVIDSATDGNPFFVQSLEATVQTDGSLEGVMVVTATRTIAL
jgi:hypothetical protein